MNNKKRNSSMIIISIILIFAMLGFGFIIGSGFMYSQYSDEISELKDMINELELNNNPSNKNTVTDFDGNVYPIVTIGKQVWIAENLKVTHYRDGTRIPNVANNKVWSQLITGALCWFQND